MGGLGGAAFAPVAKVPNVFPYFMIFLKFMGKIAGLFFGEEDNILNVTVFPPPIGGQPAAPRSFASIMHAQSSSERERQRDGASLMPPNGARDLKRGR